MLTVYKASAGSGKTFRLAIEYIKHLIVSTKSYENILAVTFTNKATEEMKMRILSQLYGLANNLDDSQNYMSVMLPELQELNKKEKFTDDKVDELFVRKRAGMALHQLLHHYNFFRVETIDRFFQTVLRNLARELDLTPNLRVELGDDNVVSEAVDRWIDSLQENDRELGWIIAYVSSSMDEDKSWNIIDKIKNFSKELLKDDYKEISEELNEKLQSISDQFFNEYTATLGSIMSECEVKAKEIARGLWTTIENKGLGVSSFKGGQNGIGSYIYKLQERSLADIDMKSKTAIKCLDTNDTDASNWVTKATPDNIREICLTTIRPAFIKAMDELMQLKKKSRSANVTKRNMAPLRMLHAIKNEIDTYNREQGSFLLSDTQTLLNKMIDNSDSPFIFEKIGARLESIMIDEFQDTSRIQWKNFKVLLADCMSHGHENLIVGDVKQSIYRWRSGDWRLLNNIEDEFPRQIKVEPLVTNRRSAVRIIKFNNEFFNQAIDNLSASIKENCSAEASSLIKAAYADVEQKYPQDKEETGYVEAVILPKDAKDERGVYKQKTMQYIVDTISMLIEKGVDQNDIAILVRDNSTIREIATYCMDQFSHSDSEVLREVKIISNEAYLLEASPAVNIIIDSLRYLADSTNAVVQTSLSVRYQRYVLRNDTPQPELIFNGSLPEAFISNARKLANMPLYQMCEEIYKIFSLADMEGQSAYLCCFFDNLMEYVQNSIGDIQSFLKYWEEKMFKKQIASDSDNGVRILSIHRSKGLEFQSVIMPFCDWQLVHKGGETLWCRPEESPYNEIPVLPLSSASLAETIYEKEYKEEKLQNEVDNINLLYVGLTRAVDNLFITTQKGQGDNNRGKIIQEVLKPIAASLGCDFSEEDNKLTYGEIVVKKDKDDEKTSNVFLIKAKPVTVAPKTTSNEQEFRESNLSKEFTLTDEDEDEMQRAQYIKLGNVMHKVLSAIKTADDIDSAILQLEMEGLLDGQDITAESLREHIASSMQNKQIADWFSKKWQIRNECAILTIDKETGKVKEHRPDRVMTNGDETIVVDFKLFSLKDDYFEQVERYMTLLKEMGYKNVRGYLWQVFSNKVREVKPKNSGQ